MRKQKKYEREEKQSRYRRKIEEKKDREGKGKKDIEKDRIDRKIKK